MEYPATFLQAHHGLAERKISLYDLTHARLNGLDCLICKETPARTPVLHGMRLLDLAVQAAWKGIIYHEHLIREHLAHHLLQHEAEGADIGATAIGMAVAYEADVVRVYDLIVQRLELVVHEGCEHGFIQDRIILGHVAIERRQRRAYRHLFI